MPMTSKVLTRPPRYLRYLEMTRWEDEMDLLVGAWRQRNAANVMRGYCAIAQADEHMVPHMFGALYIKVYTPHYKADPVALYEAAEALARRHAFSMEGDWWNVECEEAVRELGTVRHYGLASLRVITTAGVNFLTDAFQGLQNIGLMRYHGIGTGTNAESSGDTGLQTELTTQLTPASTRATGTQTEGASANIFRTVGSNQVNSTVTVAEHGIFNVAAVNTGILFDRSQFAGVGLVNGNTFQTTYDLTSAAGG